MCVPWAVIELLTAKNTSAVEIHRQLTEVHGSDVMSLQMLRKWCQEFHKGWCKVHDELHTGCPRVVTDESVNTIRALLNEDRCLILRELETIMNDDLGDPLSQMSISHTVINLGAQFYQATIQKLVSRYNKCWGLFSDNVENDVHKRNKI